MLSAHIGKPVDVLPSLLELAIALADFSGVVAALPRQTTWSSHAEMLFYRSFRKHIFICLSFHLGRGSVCITF
jgi:hypothetical protein